jgi:hypothetical protein
MRASMKKWLSQNPLPPGMSAEQFEKQLDEKFDAEMAKRSMDLELNSDGTFVFSAKIGAESSVERGTWTLDGSKLTMVTTHRDGKEWPQPEPMTAEYADGKITMSEKMEYAITFVRK